MHSFVLLALVACVLALPGAGATLAVAPPGEMPVVTRAAAAFGLGYAISAGCAFLLATVHAFHLIFFVILWLAVSAVLWVVARWRASWREHVRALGEDIAANGLSLLLGVLVLAILLILHFKFLHLLGASRYVYYQGGMQIANTSGVPSASLEYGQSWPPATDKIVLDAFTGVLVLLNPNVAIGPGVLLWLSILGSGLGLWATAWELGMRRTSILLPLVVVNNQVLFHTASAVHRVSTDFAEYRAEDFGRAVAFCALALGIYAFRQRKWVPAAAAGAVLAAASGTHLIPAAVVLIALCFAGVAELLRREGNRSRVEGNRSGVAGIRSGVAGIRSGGEGIRSRGEGNRSGVAGIRSGGEGSGAGGEGNGAVGEGNRSSGGEGNRSRLMVLRQGGVLGAAFAVLAVLIRLFAGGTLGLGGASNPSGYTAMHMSFDPTAYLFSGRFVRWGAARSGHWYVPAQRVVSDIMIGPATVWPAWAVWLLVAGALLTGILLFLLAPVELRAAGMVGAGLLAGLMGTALFFAYHYHVYVDATFGVRRLPDFATLGLAILALGLLEALLAWLGPRLLKASLAISAAVVILLSVWVLPASAATEPLGVVSHDRVVLVNWLRTHTPCNARFLVNERTEGAFTALTGRFALLEGMGPFLRPDKLGYVINLFLAARQFFQSPLSHQGFLQQHGISYVVVSRQSQLLGYGGPTGKANMPGLRAAPFLHPVLVKPFAIVYQVEGADPPPGSPLLKGPYLHCLTSRIHF